MKKFLIVLVVLIIILFAFFFIVGPYFTDKYISEELNKIKESITENDSNIFSHKELEGLPTFVQKYFKYTLRDGLIKPQFVTLKQSALFKTDEESDWEELNAVEYFSTNTPGFIWIGDLEMFDFPWVKAIDSYVNGHGKMLIKLLSSITIADDTGNQMDQSSLVRYLIESVCFPTALLPGPNVKWKSAGVRKAEVTLWDGSLNVSALFYLNPQGEVEKIQTDDRYRTTKSGYQKSPYTVYCSNYQEFNGMKIPTYIEVEWNLPAGDFKYGKFTITSAEYY